MFDVQVSQAEVRRGTTILPRMLADQHGLCLRVAGGRQRQRRQHLFVAPVRCWHRDGQGVARQGGVQGPGR